MIPETPEEFDEDAAIAHAMGASLSSLYLREPLKICSSYV
jgi:hypothetical protein